MAWVHRRRGESTATVLILFPSPSSPTRPENLSGEDLRQAGLGSDKLRFKKSCPAAPSYGSRRRWPPRPRLRERERRPEACSYERLMRAFARVGHLPGSLHESKPRDSANLNVRRGWTDSCCQGNGHIFVDRGQMTRVLIADDAGDQRALYVAPLALAGFVVDEAANGGEVIDIVARQQPDAIVLDLVMPVLDGLEVCRRLKADDRTAAIPIIVLTGHTLPGVRETVHSAGADAFLTRPCSPATLVAAIRGHLRGDAGGDEPSGSLFVRSGSQSQPRLLTRPSTP